MYHGDVPVESVTERKAAIAGRAFVVPLFEVGDSVVFVCVSTFCECFVANFAGEGLDSVGGAGVGGKLFGGCGNEGTVLAGRCWSGGGERGGEIDG